MPFSSYMNQNETTDDAYLEKGDLGSTKNLFHKFNPFERSILDYISQAQFELLDQMKESNHGSNLHSESFESLKSEFHQPPLKDEFEQSAKEITHPRRLLQSETNFINVLEENIGIGNIWENNMGEGVPFGESENGEGENESNFEGEGGEHESESDEGGPGSGETGESDGDGNGEGEGETNEDTEGSWLEGEICFDGQSSDGEIIIIEGQQSESELQELYMSRLLASDISLNINVDININIERVQEQNNEEVEATTFSITSIDPGEQTCHTERICRYVNIPRLGKRCICQQQVICLY